jgi:hypothetical protein
MLDESMVAREDMMAVESAAHLKLHARFMRRKRQQSAWDAEEARDLRSAEAVQLWTQFGCVTIVEYMEVLCGIEPRTALERLRVAHALGELPLLEAEFEHGTYQHSHVRELTRVVVAETEEEWIAHTRGMTYREVQQAVAGHVRGDRPSDPTAPDERRRFFGWHLRPSTIARVLAVLGELEAERGERFVDDDDKVNAWCDAAGGNGENAPAQVWITEDGRGFANGIELDDAELGTLTCDATIMGHVDDPQARATPTISPRTRKRLLARDGNRCTVPGCRSKRHLDLHHIVHRENGGDNSDRNTTTLGGGHHRLHHAGLLAISGIAAKALVFRRARPDGDEGSSCTRVHEPDRPPRRRDQENCIEQRP